MSFVPDIVRFNVPFIVAVAIAAISFAASFWLYSKTATHISRGKRWFFTILRSIALFFLVLLLLDPQTLLSFLLNQKPKIALVVDTSASMGIKNDTEQRADSTIKALQTARRALQGSDVEFSSYMFSTALQEFHGDSLALNGAATDFNVFGEFVRQNSFDQVLLISDGIHSSGPPPEMPPAGNVLALGVGAISAGSDVFISDVRYNPQAYLGKSETVKVRVGGRGTNGETLRLQLKQGQKVLAASMIEAPTAGSETEVELDYMLDKQGTQRYTVEIGAAGSDDNPSNNSYSYAQVVLKSKIRIGIFSGSMNYEHKFIRYLLQQDRDLEVHSFIPLLNPALALPPDSLDVVFMVDWPLATTPADEISRMAAVLRGQGQGVVIFGGERTQPAKLQQALNGVAGLNLEPYKSAPEVIVQAPQSDDPLFMLFDDLEKQQDFWRALPPVRSYWRPTDGRVFLSGASPVAGSVSLVSRVSAAPAKVWFFNGTGFWRWHFSLASNPPLADGYRLLLTNLVKRLGQKQPFRPLVLQTDARSITLGRELQINAFLFDGANSPARNGQIELQVNRDDETFSVSLNADSSGVFKGKLLPPVAGTYRLEARGLINGIPAGSATETVEVLPYQREFVRLQRDTLALRSIAEESGGRYLPIERINELDNFIEKEPNRVREDRDIIWRTQPFILALIIIVIGTEWWLRKRSDLI